MENPPPSTASGRRPSPPVPPLVDQGPDRTDRRPRHLSGGSPRVPAHLLVTPPREY